MYNGNKHFRRFLTCVSIPFLDIQRQYASLKDEIESATSEVFREGAYSGGPFVDAFEAAFASYCGTGFATGLSSGTDALHLAVARSTRGGGQGARF